MLHVRVMCGPARFRKMVSMIFFVSKKDVRYSPVVFKINDVCPGSNLDLDTPDTSVH